MLSGARLFARPLELKLEMAHARYVLLSEPNDIYNGLPFGAALCAVDIDVGVQVWLTPIISLNIEPDLLRVDDFVARLPQREHVFSCARGIRLERSAVSSNKLVYMTLAVVDDPCRYREREENASNFVFLALLQFVYRVMSLTRIVCSKSRIVLAGKKCCHQPVQLKKSGFRLREMTFSYFLWRYVLGHRLPFLTRRRRHKRRNIKRRRRCINCNHPE
jgi:hypothetical protein